MSLTAFNFFSLKLILFYLQLYKTTLSWKCVRLFLIFETDNIATPLISSMGDLASLMLLAAAATMMDWFAEMQGVDSGDGSAAAGSWPIANVFIGVKEPDLADALIANNILVENTDRSPDWGCQCNVPTCSPCSNMDVSTLNSADCWCNAEKCTTSTGRYCHSSLNNGVVKCSQTPQSCNFKNGLTINTIGVATEGINCLVSIKFCPTTFPEPTEISTQFGARSSSAEKNVVQMLPP